MKPMIAITARDRVSTADNRVFGDNESYFRYVEAGGAIPVLIECTCEEDAAQAADIFDGLLISGGPDVDPAVYDEDNCGSFPQSADLEKSDFLLYDAFLKAEKPILGICRGIQVIAAAEGTHLVQDIPTEFGTEHEQKKMVPPVERNHPLHNVNFVPGTRLHAIFGDCYGVNSFHHQCLRNVPDGFILAGTAEKEGFPEAIEKKHVTAVQWHPERMLDDPKHRQIIIDFSEECRETSASKTR